MAVLETLPLLREIPVFEVVPKPLEVPNALVVRALEVLENGLLLFVCPKAPVVPPVAEVKPGATPVLLLEVWRESPKMPLNTEAK